MRWEARATHEMWWPIAFAEPPRPDMPPLLMFRGRCVGGTTAINTKVALRPPITTTRSGTRRSGLMNDARRAVRRGRPAAVPRARRAAPRRPRAQRLAEVRPHGRAGVREARRPARVGDVVHGRQLHALRLVPAGLPDQRRQVDAEHLHPARARGARPRAAGRLRRARVIIEDRGDGPEATGVEYLGPDGETHTARRRRRRRRGRRARHARPADPLRRRATPPATRRAAELIGRNLGFHPARLVEGLFDEIQDAHMVYPITAHCMKRSPATRTAASSSRPRRSRIRSASRARCATSRACRSGARSSSRRCATTATSPGC